MILVLPFIIVFIFSKEQPINVSKNLYMPTNEYVIGVVAAEMPALFEIEALKAQAVASRTYAYRHLKTYETQDTSNIFQAYITKEEMKNRWGENFFKYYNKIEKAVLETENEIIKYNGQPILAVFHAVSAGKTEFSENIWQTQEPYLVSIDSSFDELEPGFLTEYIFSCEEFYNKLGIKPQELVEIEKSNAGYAMSVKFYKDIITANDFRRLLGLKSTNFDIEIKDENVYITTRGHGHGVGMSQRGSNYLALMGYNYKEIIYYYYKDVYVEKNL